MLRQVYPNWKTSSWISLLRIVLLGILAIGNTASGHTTENAIPLAFVGFSSPFGVVGDSTYTDVWGEGEVAYLGSTSSGVALIDISNPGSASVVTTYMPEAPFAFDSLQVHDGIGYWASSNGGGLHIVDVRNNQAQTLATIDAAFEATNNVNGFTITDNILFVSDTNSDRIFAFDIADPTTPQSLGSFETGDTIANHDLLVSGAYLYAAGLGGRTGDGTTYVYDISDFRSSGAIEAAWFESGDSTAHLSKTDTDMLVISQMRVGGGIEVWDVSDPTSPTYLTRANASDFGLNAYSTGEVFVQDEIAYVAWHQEGVQSLDLDNVSTSFSINRIGNYDTSPNTSPLSGFIGNAGVYVYPGHGRVLLSDTRWGLYVVDASKTLPVEGDFNGSGDLDVADLDSLTEIVKTQSHDEGFDLTNDDLVNRADRDRWIFGLFNTTYGDSNLDGVFDSSDLIVVFQPAEYEDGIPNNSTWTTGDWSGDGEFDSTDIILAFQTGGYEAPAAAVVPEPQLAASTLATIFPFMFRFLRRRDLTDLP